MRFFGTIEIYFRDLKEYMQEKILEGLKIEKPEDANMDVFPISFCYTIDEEDEDEI